MPASTRLQALLRPPEENRIAKFLEPAATITSATMAEPVSGIAALLTGDPENVARVQQAMTFNPRTPEGKEGIRVVAQAFDEMAQAIGLDEAAMFFNSTVVPKLQETFGNEAGSAMAAAALGIASAANPGRKAGAGSLDLSNLDEMPNIREQVAMDRYEPPRGRPENLEPLLTKETGKRMMEYAKKGEQAGGRGWYNLAPLKEEFMSVSGADKGAADFDRYVDFLAATSPRSRVDSNVRRASYLRNLEQQGRPFAGLENSDLPPGYGHLAHKTQDYMLQDLKDGGSFEALNRPKVSSFAENLKGNFEPMTLDTHNFSAIVGDPKFKKSPSKTQYKYLEEFQSELADKMNMSPAQFQASVWMGADTGVADARPFLQVFDDVVNRTAERNKVSKQQALEDFIKGNAPLYGLAAAIGAGTVLVPEENTPPAT
jgi:hypothetical protein